MEPEGADSLRSKVRSSDTWGSGRVTEGASWQGGQLTDDHRVRQERSVTLPLARPPRPEILHLPISLGDGGIGSGGHTLGDETPAPS